jgi:hypothetical protein
MLALFATDNIISESRSEGFGESQDVFSKLIWKKIEENVLNGWFPAVIRIYISLVGLDVYAKGTFYRDQRNKLIEFMEKELRPKLIDGATMSNKKYKMEDTLLPKDAIFNHSTSKFEYILSGGDHQTMNSDNSMSLMIIYPSISKLIKNPIPNTSI